MLLILMKPSCKPGAFTRIIIKNKTRNSSSSRGNANPEQCCCCEAGCMLLSVFVWFSCINKCLNVIQNIKESFTVISEHEHNYRELEFTHPLI